MVSVLEMCIATFVPLLPSVEGTVGLYLVNIYFKK